MHMFVGVQKFVMQKAFRRQGGKHITLMVFIQNTCADQEH